MLEMNANDRTDIDVARAGDIIAVVGCKDTTTGETLCDPDSPVILEKMDFPEPVIKVSVEPKTKADQEKMTNALIKLAAEDPSFRFSRDEETGQTIIEGMGELHLEIIVDWMMHEFNIEANAGAPRSLCPPRRSRTTCRRTPPPPRPAAAPAAGGGSITTAASKAAATKITIAAATIK